MSDANCFFEYPSRWQQLYEAFLSDDEGMLQQAIAQLEERDIALEDHLRNRPCGGGGWAGGTYGSIGGDSGSVVDYLWDQATWAAIPGDLWVMVTVNATFQAGESAVTGAVGGATILGSPYWLDVDDRATAPAGGWASISSSWVEHRPAGHWGDLVSAWFDADAAVVAGRMRISWVAQPMGGKNTHTLVAG